MREMIGVLNALGGMIETLGTAHTSASNRLQEMTAIALRLAMKLDPHDEEVQVLYLTLQMHQREGEITLESLLAAKAALNTVTNKVEKVDDDAA